MERKHEVMRSKAALCVRLRSQLGPKDGHAVQVGRQCTLSQALDLVQTPI
jgi:hypothetical protein